jgi:hypothetical protein
MSRPIVSLKRNTIKVATKPKYGESAKEYLERRFPMLLMKKQISGDPLYRQQRCQAQAIRTKYRQNADWLTATFETQLNSLCPWLKLRKNRNISVANSIKYLNKKFAILFQYKETITDKNMPKDVRAALCVLKKEFNNCSQWVSRETINYLNSALPGWRLRLPYKKRKETDDNPYIAHLVEESK